tara:strand:- start:3887 stop:4234 length:348 start_codon:yes stop_codon:yes gene_type:complete
VINDLIKLATHLDNKGFHKEANYVDALVKRAGELLQLDQSRSKEDLYDIDRRKPRPHEVIFLSDGETWDGEAFIAQLTDDEYNTISEGGRLTIDDIPEERVTSVPSFDHSMKSYE